MCLRHAGGLIGTYNVLKEQLNKELSVKVSGRNFHILIKIQEVLKMLYTHILKTLL